jgi:two-component system, cell cycle sensor histidine kinase and response regulator CckA
LKLHTALPEGEDSYKQIVESLSDYVYTVQIENNRATSTTHGRGCEHVTGYTSAEYDADPLLWHRMIHKEDREGVLEQIADILSGKGITTFEHRIIHKDGSTRWVRKTQVARYDPKGTLIAYYGIIKDITEFRESEIRYRRLYESAGDAIFLLKGDCFVDCNQKALEMFACTREQIIGKSPFHFSPPCQPDRRDSRETVLEKVSAALDGTPQIYQWSYIRGDGISFDAEVSLNRVELSPGFHVQAIVRDVTERKRMEETLRSHEALLDTIINTEPDCVKLLEQDGTLIMMNQSGLDMIDGDSLEEVKGRVIYPMIRPEYREAFMALTEKVFQGKSGRLEFEATGLKGRKLWLETHAVPLRDKTSDIAALLGITRNITEQKRTEEQLRKLSRAVEQSPASVIITDLKGNIEYVNPAFVQITGYGRDEVMGQTPRILKSGETSDEEYKKLWETITSGSEWRGEFHNKKKDGQLYWESAIISPVKDETGRIINFLAVKEDITERKNMEEEQETFFTELQEMIVTVSLSQKEWRETFDSITDVIFITDTDCNIVKVNRAAETMLGRPLIQLLGEKCYALFHGAASPPGYCAGRLCLKTGKPAGLTLYEPHLKMFIDIKTLPKFGSDHKMAGLIHVVRDVTGQKTLEEQLQQAQKMEAVGQLAGGIAHDFNNLLTAIISCGKLLEIKMGNETPHSVYVKHILDASQRAANVVKGLLAFSRKQIFYPDAVNINDIIHGAEQLMRRTITEDIDLRLTMTTEMLTVMADKTQIEQVLINLLANARDAMPSGGIVTIGTEVIEFDRDFVRMHGFLGPGKYALLTISDSGTGMTEETKEKIFEPFFTTKDVGKGTGLGLSIVYGIIKQHGGHINIFSTPGFGSAVKIYLPLIAAETADEEITELNLPEGGGETVLFAEDDAVVRDITGNLLREFGYDVLAAADGEEAVSIFTLNKDRIQLVIIDVIMPRLNGSQAYEEIKKIRPDIRTLFMSGYTADILQSKRVIEDSLNFIAKPVSPFTLLTKIRELLDAGPGQKGNDPL